MAMELSAGMQQISGRVTKFRYKNGVNFQRLQEHENQLAKNLVEVRNPKRLKRIWPCDLRRK
jgi:hypothetical protein